MRVLNIPHLSFVKKTRTAKEIRVDVKGVSEYLHFRGHISRCTSINAGHELWREAAGARIPLAGTPDTDFGRALGTILPNSGGTRGHAGESPGDTGRARSRMRAPRAASSDQSAQRWELEVYVEPAAARAECGSGVRLLNNAAEFQLPEGRYLQGWDGSGKNQGGWACVSGRRQDWFPVHHWAQATDSHTHTG